jgi:hypothetical protein
VLKSSCFWLAGATLYKANPKSKLIAKNIYEQPVHSESFAAPCCQFISAIKA